MIRILSVDGGGTKINAVLTDENMNVLGRGVSGGTNPNQSSRETARRHMEECLGQVFAAGVPDVIDDVYVILVGDLRDLKDALETKTRVGKYTVFSEARGGLLAGVLRQDGLLALSGTGSDVFFIDAAGRERGVGGRGPIAGDYGSGAWIGQAAVRAVMRERDGWGEPTRLTPMLLKAWKAESDDWEIVRILHSSPAPYSQMAQLTHLVGEAADAGDAVALRIVRQAGEYMARQMAALLCRLPNPPSSAEVALCGGAWKTHPAMRDSFLRHLRETCPDASAEYPLFEHVCAGPVFHLLKRNVPASEIRDLLTAKMPMYRIARPGGG